MKYYLPFVKKYWHCFLLGPFFMVLEACGEFLLPYLSANLIDEGAAKGNTAYVLSQGAWMVALAALMMLTGILGAKYSVKGSTGFAAGIRRKVFESIQGFTFSDIDKFTAGSLITRLTNDVTQVQNFTQTLLRGMFRAPIMLIGALIVSFTLNQSLAWILLAVVPLLGISIAVIISVASPRYTKMQRQLDTLNIEIQETVTNQRVIKSFVREDYQKEKFLCINEKLSQRCMSALKMMLFMQPISALAINVTTIAVVWVAGKQIMVGSMEIGELTAFITYLSQVLTALTFVAGIVLQGTRAAASHRRIREVLEERTDLFDCACSCDRTVQSGSIELKNISFRYYKNSKEKVLKNINLTISSGELVGIVGSTGSGKSTLVSLIPRLYDPDEGTVLIDGFDAKKYSIKALRDAISVVLQKNTLFSGTIGENLSWGDPDATPEEWREAAKIARAHEFISSFPAGYETELVQGGKNLSGGQKQRLCIARALLKRPKILILDDSTSAVDNATDASIRRSLREKLPGVTKLIIAQRIHSVMDADKIVVMNEGSIVGCGTHNELLSSCKEYQEIYYSQKDKEESHDGK